MTNLVEASNIPRQMLELMAYSKLSFGNKLQWMGNWVANEYYQGVTSAQELWRGKVPGTSIPISRWEAAVGLVDSLSTASLLFPAVDLIGLGTKEALLGAKAWGSLFESLGKEDLETVTLYRAVTPEELKQISETNTFVNPYGIQEKYFATSLEGAQQYA